MSNRSRRAELTALSTALGALVAVAATICFAPEPATAQSAPASPRAYLQRMDANRDGRVDEAEYLDYMGRGFARMDSDGNGILEGDELPPGSRPVTLVQYQQNLRAAFRRQDGNHDGFLSSVELSRPPPAR